MDTEILKPSKRYSPIERRTAVASFLRTLGAAPGIQIEFNGLPRTDGQTVWLGDCTYPTQYFETLALGHGIHEMMHVMHTDFTQAASLDKLTALVLNALEDVRLDRLGTQNYPAYRPWRERLAACCLRLGRMRVQKGPYQSAPTEDLITWMHCEMCARDGYRWALANVTQLRRRVLAVSAKCRHALLRACSGVDTAANTADCVRIAHKIRRILEEEFHRAREMQARERDLELDSTGSLFEEEDARKTCELPLASTEFLNVVMQNASLPAVPSQAAPARLGYGPGSDDSAPEMRYRAGVWPNMSAKMIDRSMRREFVTSFEKASQNLSATVRAFSQLLNTKDEWAGSRFAQEGIDFRDDWLDTLACSDRHVFEVSDTGRAVNAEILVLLDRSGSMGVSTMTMAKLSVLSLLTVLSRVRGVTSTVSAFPGLGDKHVAVVKKGHETLEALRGKLPGIDAFGSTPIFEAMRWAFDAFAASRARDKLLLVITDGRFPAERSRPLQATLKSVGIELALLSIGVDNREAAANHVLVQGPEEINDGLVRLLSATDFAKAVRR